MLVKNTYSGINYIDTYLRSGLYPSPSFPYTLGYEGEGKVVAIGNNTAGGFAVGDYVGYIHSDSQAEYTVVDADRTVKIPQEIEEGILAASLIQGITALSMIKESYPVKKGDVVLVHAAAGGVGLWLLQLLRHIGAAKIIATASTEEKLAAAKQHGATHVINYSATDGEDWVSRVKEITKEDGGVMAVFDGVGKATFDGDLEVLARKGSLVSFGNASGAVPPFSITRLASKNLKVLRPTIFGYITTKEEFDMYVGQLVELLKEKKVEINIHKTYTLAEAQQAHKDLEARITQGKLLFKL